MKWTVAIITGALVFAVAGMTTAQDFQCFKAKDTAKAFSKTSGTVVDTFAGATATDFKKPFLLCDGASVNGSTAATGKLSCFKVKGAKLDPSQSLSVTDQFGTRSEEIKKAFVVCVTATAS